MDWKKELDLYNHIKMLGYQLFTDDYVIRSQELVLRCYQKYRQISNISHTLTGNKIVEHSDVVEASPVGAAPTTSSFST